MGIALRRGVFRGRRAIRCTCAQADEAYCIGPAPAAESYLRRRAHPRVARATGAQAIHPGYGFLSRERGLRRGLRSGGHRVHRADARADARLRPQAHARANSPQRSGVPLLPGTDLLPDLPAALAAAQRIGYPVMLKSTAGGGGIGMRRLQQRARTRAKPSRRCSGWPQAIHDAGVFLEKYVARARHIEVQIFGDGARHT